MQTAVFDAIKMKGPYVWQISSARLAGGYVATQIVEDFCTPGMIHHQVLVELESDCADWGVPTGRGG